MNEYVTTSRGSDVQKHIAQVREISLEAIDVSHDLFLADGTWAIDVIKIGYVYAANITDISYGVNVMFGTYAQPAKFAAWSSSLTASVGDYVTLSLNKDKRVLSSNDWLVLRTAGALQGAGMISVYVYLSRLR